MSLTIDKNGTISLYQGDSGEVMIKGLNPYKKYDVYFAIRNKHREPVGNEIKVTVNKQEIVTFVLTSSMTDMLKVSKDKDFEVYTYGVKVRDTESGDEDTLFVTGKDYGEQNLLIVYPKQVEGL